MATLLNNVPNNGHPIRADFSNMVYVVEDVVNFATTTGNQNDVVEMLEIPAGTMVLTAGVNVLTADATGSLGVTLGDGGSTARWVSNQAVASTGQVARTTNYNYIYTSADTIDLIVVGAAAATLKVRVWAVLIPLPALKTAQTATYAA